MRQLLVGCQPGLLGFGLVDKLLLSADQAEWPVAVVAKAACSAFVSPWYCSQSLPCASLSADVFAHALGSFATVTYCLLILSPEVYGPALQRASATEQAVLSVLLDRCLPVVAADCTAETLAEDGHPHRELARFLGLVLQAPCLQDRVTRQMQQPQGAAYIRQALRVVAALPLQRSPVTEEADLFGDQHVGAAALLASLCAPDGCFSIPDSTVSAVYGRFVGALPRIAAMLTAVAGDESIPAERLARFCYELQLAAEGLFRKLPSFRSDSYLAAWAGAADASLRPLPVLLRLHEGCRFEEEPELRQAPLQLGRQLVSLLDHAKPASSYVEARSSGTQPATAAEGQPLRQLWALHTSMCRLMAWLAADPTGARAAMLPGGSLGGTASLLASFSSLRFALLVEAEGGTLR